MTFSAIDLKLVKKIISSLDKGNSAEYNELKIKNEEVFGEISDTMFSTNLELAKSLGLLSFYNNKYKLSRSGWIFKVYSKETESLTPLEKYMFLQELLKYKALRCIFSQILKKKKISYSTNELTEIVSKIFENTDERKLEVNEFIELMEQLDLIQKDEDFYYLNPKLEIYKSVAPEDSISNLLLRLYFPSSLPSTDFEVEKRIKDICKRYEVGLPILETDLRKMVVYDLLKDNQRVTFSQVKKCIKILMFLNEIHFRKIGKKIWITGINDFSV